MSGYLPSRFRILPAECRLCQPSVRHVLFQACLGYQVILVDASLRSCMWHAEDRSAAKSEMECSRRSGTLIVRTTLDSIRKVRVPFEVLEV